MVTLRIHCVTDGSRSIACVTTHWISLICGDFIQRVLARLLNILYKSYIFHRKDFIFQNQRSINCGCKCSKYCHNCHFWQKREMGGVVSCLVLPTDLYTPKKTDLSTWSPWALISCQFWQQVLPSFFWLKIFRYWSPWVPFTSEWRARICPKW